MSKKDNSTPVFSMRLDAEVRAKLEKIAQRDDRDVAYIIRKAIEEYIRREEKR
jgi:predicted transcriptional regulator